MRRTSLLHGVAVLLLSAGTAMAQDAGGIGFAAGGVSAANLAQAFAQPPRQPVFASGTRRGAPAGAMVTNPGQSRTGAHQQLIAKIRGDAGFLAGFQKGQPLAASRNPPPEIQPNLTFIDAPFIVNNINSALNIALGEGNSTGQDVATSSGDTFVSGGGGDASGGVAVAETPASAADPGGHRHKRGRGRSDGAATAVAAPTVAPPATMAPGATAGGGATPTAGAAPADRMKLPKPPPLPKFPKMPDGPAAPNFGASTPGVAPGQPDALATTLGPLPYLPFAMKNGGVQFNNSNSAINIAAGVGNVAGQKVKTIQR